MFLCSYPAYGITIMKYIITKSILKHLNYIFKIFRNIKGVIIL